MNVDLKEITERELVDGYEDDDEGGVIGYGAHLDIRLTIANENSTISDTERNAAVNSILKGFPLNVMYWADREDGTFEMIHGQPAPNL